MADESYMKARMAVEDILHSAYDLFLKRDDKYKGLWRDGGAEDNGFHMRHKAMRTFRVFQDQLPKLKESDLVDWATREKLMEDAYDLINYAAFYIYCVKNGLWECQDDEGKEETPSPVGNWGLTPDDDD
jgi:hypothetical protein